MLICFACTASRDSAFDLSLSPSFFLFLFSFLHHLLSFASRAPATPYDCLLFSRCRVSICRSKSRAKTLRLLIPSPHLLSFPRPSLLVSAACFETSSGTESERRSKKLQEVGRVSWEDLSRIFLFFSVSRGIGMRERRGGSKSRGIIISLSLSSPLFAYAR